MPFRPGFNARTRVHEYGGGAYTVRDGVLIFSNFSDTRLYRVDGDDAPRPITPEGALRYADMIFDPDRARLIAVREDHSGDGEAVNTIVALDPNGDESGGMVLTSGADFYSNPRLSPDGRRLAWLQWNHPNMPWDGSELWVGEIGEDGMVSSSELIAGGPQESIFQPEWAPDGTLYFVSDRTGWWNLYRRSGDGDEAVAPMEAEFGLPQWVFGMATYAFLDPRTILATYTRDGTWHLVTIDTESGRAHPDRDAVHRDRRSVRGRRLMRSWSAASPTLPTAIVRYDPASGNIRDAQAIARRRDRPRLSVDSQRRSSSRPRTASRRTPSSICRGTRTSPRRRVSCRRCSCRATADRPARTSTALSLPLQYWTSRGFAVLDVNYGGSTGYGRPYRQRLNDAWGIVDVDDHVNGAQAI